LVSATRLQHRRIGVSKSASVLSLGQLPAALSSSLTALRKLFLNNCGVTGGVPAAVSASPV